MSTPLVDIGINLGHDSYAHDRSQVIERARAAGVGHFLVTGADLPGTRRALELAREHPHIMRATAGVHPHHAADLTEERMPELETLMRSPEVVAAGECGLDYFRDLSPRAAQERAFRWQLELAARTGKPAFLHQRDAHEDFLRIVREYRPQLCGGVAHCFTGSLAQAQEYLALGLYIGITGWINDERRGQHLKEVVTRIPADRLLIETDGPYLLPRDLPRKPESRRNEPMYLPHILGTIAAARGESPDSLAAATTANARRLFGWPE